ncbi:hypothetical protein L6452_05689 [Arctium lappa]|uniref:Uncharacterized protein n=1 Tax=Arctium lappa TaxID=4217 RepID=A0ACB9EGI2_ARCLA|nr:hypothetical protein L6452_05689 [Arctium lappa]
MTKPIAEYTPNESLQYKADRDIKANLMLALPNSIYNRIDCYKNNPKLMWAQLEKIMLRSTVATQLRHTRYMNNFEEFKVKDGESLKNIFDRFCAVINDLRKIKVEKTELETNLKFLNSLQSEWNKSCHRLRNDTVDPVALLTSKLSEQALSENAYDGATYDDGEALQKAMILLSQHYNKKFQPRSGSNNLRFTSGSKIKVPEHKKAADCFNCGKPGHIAKECQVKIVRDLTYYRKKMELAEKRENGTALLAEEEFWLDHSDDEADNVETTHMCFIEDDQSDDNDDDSSTDEDEASSNLMTDQFGFLGKIASFDSNLKSKILDDSFTLNDDYYKPKRKRNRSKKSKKQVKVISANSNSCDSNISYRTMRNPTNEIWRLKRTSDEPATDEDRYVDKFYKSDSFAVCNKMSKYSIKQMIQISKDVSYSSSDSSSNDYVLSSTDEYVHFSENISRAFYVKSNKFSPIRISTNKYGPKYMWVPKSKIDSKLQAPNMPMCTSLKDAKEHTHVKMPMCTMLKDAIEYTSHDTWSYLSRLQRMHDQVDPDHQDPTTTVHSSTFERSASSRAQADEPIVLSSLLQTGPVLSRKQIQYKLKDAEKKILLVKKLRYVA